MKVNLVKLIEELAVAAKVESLVVMRRTEYPADIADYRAAFNEVFNRYRPDMKIIDENS